jgi:hypothetical protein
VVNDTVDAAYEGIEAVKNKGKEIAGNIWDAITGAATSNFVDTRTAAALGDQPNIENNTKALGEVRDVLAKLQKNPQYKEYKEYFADLQETIGDLLSPDNNYGNQRPDTQTGNRAESQAPEETDGISVYLKQIVYALQSINSGILQGINIDIPAVSLEGNPLGALLEEFSKIGEKFANSKIFDGMDVVGMMEKGMQAIQPMAPNEYRDYAGNTTVTNNSSPSFKIDVGGVTINGAGKTNSDVGKEVGSAVMQAASRFFADNCLLNGSRPTKTAIEQYSN